MEQSLNTLISNTSHIKMDTYHAQLQYAEYTSRMMKLGCYLFMAIVGLIGFMNLANTMIINITTKKQEYGVLQAVGMTNKQLNLSLQIQGLILRLAPSASHLLPVCPLAMHCFPMRSIMGFWNERLSRSSYPDSCYDSSGWYSTNCAFLCFKQ